MSGLQKVNSAKHHKSPSYQSACAFFLSGCVSASGVAGPAAPAVAGFEELLTMLKQGRPHVNLAGSPKALDHAGRSG